MSDYEAMTNYEINRAVLIAAIEALGPIKEIFSECRLGGTMDGIEMSFCREDMQPKYKCADYCDNTAYAWPIIDSIWWKLLSVDEYGVTEWARNMRHEHDKDKLRAACIVYLKLQEQSNERV